MASGRIPRSPRRTELFRILILQGEAALKNLDLLRGQGPGHPGRPHRPFQLPPLLGIPRPRSGAEPALPELPHALLFLDLDNFKIINDALGHSRGDVVLKALADYLRTALRHADVVCRYGGEEFVALLPKTQVDRP